MRGFCPYWKTRRARERDTLQLKYIYLSQGIGPGHGARHFILPQR
jgi:hypothetical protein